ncbi:TetR family transcriptional regulator [Nocardioides nitrophenolicus]|uniref:TetR family transcriptional regulator n=1 Tax=Nocardioides nitrophenolicus TaxID=60489 RepID=UPI00195841F3|nr:TetR family transcriptional regulator [Nocardioides nitrophenolicus]MBM7517195.1 AcrR family transcriptional regulator [Nocardioides nitrophenolicus]
MSTPAEERIRTAAFDLFTARGFDATTVDDIAAAAGVGRTTFFRKFRAKEDAVFPPHDELLAELSARLHAADPDEIHQAVLDAARFVFAHYLAEGQRARQRYTLTRTVPALQIRELVGTQEYVHLFRTALHAHAGDDGFAAAHHDEQYASAVVTAHNYVLRRWLRGDTQDHQARAELERAFDDVRDRLAAPAGPRGGVTTTVVVVAGSTDPDSIAAQVRSALTAD